MVHFLCLLLLFIHLITIVENKGSAHSSGHSAHSGHSGHSVTHGSNHFKHVGENVQQRLSSIKSKFQDVILSIKEKAAGHEQTPQEITAYLQKGAESGLFKTIKRTVNDFFDRLKNPRGDQSGVKSGNTLESSNDKSNGTQLLNNLHNEEYAGNITLKKQKNYRNETRISSQKLLV